MGCHTWFYNKLETQPDYETIRLKVLSSYSEYMNTYIKHINGSLSDGEIWLFEDYTIDQLKHNLEILKRQYRLIEARYCKIATMKKYATISMRLWFSKSNNLFYAETDNHEIPKI